MRVEKNLGTRYKISTPIGHTVKEIIDILKLIPEEASLDWVNYVDDEYSEWFFQAGDKALWEEIDTVRCEVDNKK